MTKKTKEVKQQICQLLKELGREMYLYQNLEDVFNNLKNTVFHLTKCICYINKHN